MLQAQHAAVPGLGFYHPVLAFSRSCPASPSLAPRAVSPQSTPQSKSLAKEPSSEAMLQGIQGDSGVTWIPPGRVVLLLSTTRGRHHHVHAEKVEKPLHRFQQNKNHKE